MWKTDVHAYFRTLAAIAKAVGISKQGVWMWPELVPEGHAYKLQFVTQGKLQVDASLYLKPVRIKRKGVIAPIKRRSKAHLARAAK
jgi:hypothetical protein